MSDLTTRRITRQPRVGLDPERAAAWERLQEVQERLRIGYHGQATEDLAWAVEQLLKLWDINQQRERLRELLDQEQGRVTDLRSRNGTLLVQNDRLREDNERLCRAETEHVVATGQAVPPAVLDDDREERRTAGRTDWMEPEYGLLRPELTLMLNLAACRIERQTFVRELERLDWPRGQADELADLLCALLAAGSVRAGHDRARQENAESPSIALIAAERQRQVEAEGWTAKHDDRHVDAELARAAACYALPPDGGRDTRLGLPVHWPFEARSWRPTPDDRVHELVKAGGLIAAEIDRLLRKAGDLPAAAEVER